MIAITTKSSMRVNAFFFNETFQYLQGLANAFDKGPISTRMNESGNEATKRKGVEIRESNMRSSSARLGQSDVSGSEYSDRKPDWVPEQRITPILEVSVQFDRRSSFPRNDIEQKPCLQALGLRTCRRSRTHICF